MSGFEWIILGFGCAVEIFCLCRIIYLEGEIKKLMWERHKELLSEIRKNSIPYYVVHSNRCGHGYGGGTGTAHIF